MVQTRNSERLRTRIFWVLVTFGSAPMLVALIFNGSPWLVAGAVTAVAISFMAGFFVSGFLVAPLLELSRRLAVKNFGNEDDNPSTAPLDLNQSFTDIAARRGSRYIDLLGLRDAPLPAEVAEIERLARAGTVTEMALESVKKDLFRHLSHQLKSPMALIQAHVLSVRQRLGGDTSGAEANLKSIEDITMSVGHLVEQMLSMAWIERLGERGPIREKVNLSFALMQLVSMRNSLPIERGIVLDTAVDANLWVRGDKHLLQEMVSALVDNAIRHSPDGGMVMVEAKRIAATKTLMVQVTDEGPGIPPSERENVFEPFYGATGTDDKGVVTYGTRRHRAMPQGFVKSSHGLGLSLVRGVARLHGAQITLDSGPGNKGLVARILVPATYPASTDGRSKE